MKSFTSKSTVTQLADHLREEILSGGIRHRMPGVNRLVRELGLGTQTVIAAISALEKEGLLKNLGGRHGRRIIMPRGKGTARGLTVRILLYEGSDAQKGYLVDLCHRLQEAGHAAEFCSKSLMDLKMNPKQVARYVEKTNADAWVVFVGSKPVLQWFASQPFPSFALFGRGANVSMPGLMISKEDPMIKIVRRLVQAGHRRIVLMTREERRKPELGPFERRYLEELQALGIPVGAYNIPHWDNHPESFQACLGQLFAHTPPTAMFFDEPMLYFGAMSFFNRHRIQIPADLSAVVLDSHPTFEWCYPVPTSIGIDPSQTVNKIMLWIRDVCSGVENHRKTLLTANITEGDTIAPVR